MKAINAWTANDCVKIFYRDENAIPVFKRAPKEYTGFVHELPANLMDDGRVIGHRPDNGWHRILFRDYDARIGWLQANPGIDIKEADVSPVKRILADYDIETIRGRRCYIDIETDPRIDIEQAIAGNARILMIAVCDDEGKKYQYILAADSDDAERAMLHRFFRLLDFYDWVIGWNSDGFDQLVIEARAKVLDLRPDRRLIWLDFMLAFKRMNLQVGSAEDKISFSLNSVAESQLGVGEGKHDYDVSNLWDDWKAGGERQARAAGYNMQDAELLPQIAEKTGYLEAFMAICEVCHLFPSSHSLKPTAQMDGIMLRLARQEGTHLPTKIDRIETKSLPGAYVMPPTRSGIIKDVSVLDYASLYPSIIQTWNLSFDTIVGPEYTGDVCVTPTTGLRSRVDIRGMVPRILDQFGKLRKYWKDKKSASVPNSEEYRYADRMQNAYKTLMNSMYGVIASIYSRLHNYDLSLAVTATGQWCLKLLADEARTFNVT